MFFKLCLVGYLENIISDRKLFEHCGPVILPLLPARQGHARAAHPRKRNQ
jgi:hypothetical protein